MDLAQHLPPAEARISMKKAYFAVVVVSVGAHFAYLVYLPSGGFLALRWPRSIWLHLASVGWGVLVVTLPVPCPLTSLEDWARARAGMEPLPSTGFVDRYVAGVLYPPGRTGIAQALPSPRPPVVGRPGEKTSRGRAQ